MIYNSRSILAETTVSIVFCLFVFFCVVFFLGVRDYVTVTSSFQKASENLLICYMITSKRTI